MTRGDAHDDGFGLVEVLMALAIASLVTIGTAGVLAFSRELHVRTVQAEVVEAAIMKLSTLAALVEGSLPSRIDGTAYDRFGIEALGAMHPRTPIVRFALQGGQLLVGADGDQSQAVSPSSFVDLSAFDAAEFEYLVDSTEAFTWVTADQIGRASVLASRIVLIASHRRWPVVLWLAPLSGKMSQAQLGNLTSHSALRKATS